MRSFVLGLLGGLVAIGIAGAVVLAVGTARGGGSGFARFTADEIVAEFRSKGLRVDESRLGSSGLSYYVQELTAREAQSKDAQQFGQALAPGNAWVFTFHTERERDAAIEYLSRIHRARVVVHHNAVLVMTDSFRGMDNYLAVLVAMR